MKQRLLTGWSFIRVLYVVLGLFLAVQSFLQQQWLGIFIGGYFASIGIFAFGCAANKCCGNNCTTEKSKKVDSIEKNKFEEKK